MDRVKFACSNEAEDQLFVGKASVMPALPKPLVLLGASVRTAATTLRLRYGSNPVAAQHRTWRALMGRFGRTVHGRAAHLGAGLSYEQFQARVPLQTYEQIAPLIERMKHGEADMLWPGQCSFYVLSAGTTTGRPKYLPITGEMMAHFRRAAFAAGFYYTARVGHTGVLRGRHLFLGGSTALASLPESRPFEAYAGDLSSIVAFSLPVWVEKHLYEPGAEIARIGDWDAKVKAITERCWQRDITLLAGMPNWLLVLAEALRVRARSHQRPVNQLRELWPNLECLVHSGMPLGPFVDELRQVLGPGVKFHEVYAAAEGFIAAQDTNSSQGGLRLMADTGLFFEFLPMHDYDETRLASLGAKAVPLEGVKPGVDYALLVTTPAGLCRHAVGDVVRFLATKPPRLIYVGRTKLQLRAFGENVLEKEITDALTSVCAHHGWQIVNFHLAPIFASSLTGQTRGCHEWWVELKPGTVETPTGPVLAAGLDAELRRLNADYSARRKSGIIEPPVVRLVMPGVFEQWMRHRARWGGQHKMPRCRSDREIADELAQLARFHA